MSNTISLLSYANTFGDWLVATDYLILNWNGLYANNFFKPTGTLYLNDPILGLVVANNAIFGGLLSSQGVGSSAYIQNNLTVGGQVYFTNTSLGLTNSGDLIVLGTNYLRGNVNVSNTLYVSGLTTISNNLIVYGNITSSGHVTANDFIGNGQALTLSNTQIITALGYVPAAGSGLGYVPTQTSAGSNTNSVVSNTSLISVSQNPRDMEPGFYVEVKTNGVDGLTDGGSTHGVLTFRAIGTGSNFTAGQMEQIAYTDNGSLYHRLSTGAGSWGSWLKLLDSSNYSAYAGFDAGTRMTFQQAAAPTGWTRDTSAALNDSAMRIVTGSVGSGGSSGFTTVFTSRTPTGTVASSYAGPSTTGAHTLTLLQIPAHNHSVPITSTSGGGSTIEASETSSAAPNITTGNAGGGQSHTHPLTNGTVTSVFTGAAMNFAVKYFDFLLAEVYERFAFD